MIVKSEDSHTGVVRILTVDDSHTFQECICRLLLGQASFRIVGKAFDGIGAVQMAEKLRPDIVTMDIGLPSLDGLSAARRIAMILPTTKILFLTANNDPQIVRAALDAGAAGFVIKTDVDELLDALRALHLGKQHLSKSVELDT